MQKSSPFALLARVAALSALPVSVCLFALGASAPEDPLRAGSEEALFSATPVNDLGTGTYLGFEGGLYPNGTNVLPSDHLARGLAHASGVIPRDRLGSPSSAGKIVLVSVGMSNTTDEFCASNNPAPCDAWSFMGQAAADSGVNHDTLAIVNGAAGGQAASHWISPTDDNYDRVRNTDLQALLLTEAQVQAAWVKVADPVPTVSLPSSSADAYTLESYMGDIVRAMKVRYPNLQLVYLSSRIYAGYATVTLNPEPYAYESGFAVKWLIQAQINQMRTGTVDPVAGDLNSDTVAPWIAWGPYLWADGTVPRSDGLVWLQADLQHDGTHPSMSGVQKVGSLLLSFFKNDATSMPWFLAQSALFPPPIASFTFAPAMPRAARRFRFTDTSTESPTSWSWSFGDGSSSTLQNPVHFYTSAGDFTVILTATNAGGSSTATQTVTVKRCELCTVVVPLR